MTNDDEPEQMHRGFVLFVRAGADRLIKICWAVDPDARFAQLAADCCDEPVLLAVVPGSQAMEQRLHAQFEKWRVRADWFLPTPALRAYVKACIANSQDQGVHKRDQGIHRQDQGSSEPPYKETRAREPESSSDQPTEDRTPHDLGTTTHGSGQSDARARTPALQQSDQDRWRRRFDTLRREVGRKWGAQADHRLLMGGGYMSTLQALSVRTDDQAWSKVLIGMLRRRTEPKNIYAYLTAALEEQELEKESRAPPSARRTLPPAGPAPADAGLEAILGAPLADLIKKVQGGTCTHDGNDEASQGNAARSPQGLHQVQEPPEEHAAGDHAPRDRGQGPRSVRADRPPPGGAGLELGDAGTGAAVQPPVRGRPRDPEGRDAG